MADRGKMRLCILRALLRFTHNSVPITYVDWYPQSTQNTPNLPPIPEPQPPFERISNEPQIDD